MHRDEDDSSVLAHQWIETRLYNIGVTVREPATQHSYNGDMPTELNLRVQRRTWLNWMQWSRG